MGADEGPTGGPAGPGHGNGSGVLADLQYLLNNAAELITRSRRLLADITARFVAIDARNENNRSGDGEHQDDTR
jgi:hypothetical protein